ncbi:MAG: hypothetical protein KBT20_09270 [Bacteroidales bacterium]|nr:hypothetical protein [Candidatus Liminaster caballi]
MRSHHLLSFLLFWVIGITIANAQNKPVVTLNADAVQAANLESYSQVRGSWQFVISNGNDVVATIPVITSGYNHIAGIYDLAGTQSLISVNDEESVIAGELSVSFVSQGSNFPVYTFEGTLETASHIYTLDLTTEVFAYDYLCYLYYEMGAFTYEQILVVLDDAPAGSEHDTFELTMNHGAVTDYIDTMGALKVEADDEDGLILQLVLDADQLNDGATYPLSSTYTIYCYLGDMNTQVYLAYFKSGTVSLKVVADNTVDLDANLVAKGGDVYHIILSGLECEGVTPGTDIKQTQLNDIISHLSSKRLINGRLTIERNGKLWNLDGTKK